MNFLNNAKDEIKSSLSQTDVSATLQTVVQHFNNGVNEIRTTKETVKTASKSVKTWLIVVAVLLAIFILLVVYMLARNVKFNRR